MVKKRIGHIVNYFGLNGGLKVLMDTDYPELRFKVGNIVEIEGKQYKVADLKMKNPKTGQVWLENIISIDQAEKMVGQDIYAEIEPLPGQVFVDDLIGCQVLSPKGAVLGTVDDVVKMVRTDYLKLASGRFVPFTLGLFVQEYDLAAKKIVLTALGEEALQ